MSVPPFPASEKNIPPMKIISLVPYLKRNSPGEKKFPPRKVFSPLKRVFPWKKNISHVKRLFPI
jgi:hypothetical protein